MNTFKVNNQFKNLMVQQNPEEGRNSIRSMHDLTGAEKEMIMRNRKINGASGSISTSSSINGGKQVLYNTPSNALSNIESLPMSLYNKTFFDYPGRQKHDQEYKNRLYSDLNQNEFGHSQQPRQNRAQQYDKRIQEFHPRSRKQQQQQQIQSYSYPSHDFSTDFDDYPTNYMNNSNDPFPYFSHSVQQQQQQNPYVQHHSQYIPRHKNYENKLEQKMNYPPRFESYSQFQTPRMLEKIETYRKRKPISHQIQNSMNMPQYQRNSADQYLSTDIYTQNPRKTTQFDELILNPPTLKEALEMKTIEFIKVNTIDSLKIAELICNQLLAIQYPVVQIHKDSLATFAQAFILNALVFNSKYHIGILACPYKIDMIAFGGGFHFYDPQNSPIPYNLTQIMFPQKGRRETKSIIQEYLMLKGGLSIGIDKDDLKMLVKIIFGSTWGEKQMDFWIGAEYKNHKLLIVHIFRSKLFDVDKLTLQQLQPFE